jgi:siroheme synthase-like protein
MNFRYPIFLDVAGKPCLVTGEGPEIPAKIQRLVASGARVSYVNPTANEAVAALAADGQIEWHARHFEASDLDGCFLVIAARNADGKIFRLAEERNVLCNTVDDPAHCRFSFGSVVSRDDLVLAISTNGVAPALAVRLRERLEQEFGAEYAEFVAMLGELRPHITREVPDFASRRALWYRLVDSEALGAIRRGEPAKARQLLQRLVDEAKQHQLPDTVKGESGT